MSFKKYVAALVLSSVAAFAWLGLSAAAAAPPSPLKQLDQELGLHAKKHHGHKHGAKHAAKATAGKKHHKHHHKA